MGLAVSAHLSVFTDKVMKGTNLWFLDFPFEKGFSRKGKRKCFIKELTHIQKQDKNENGNVVCRKNISVLLDFSRRK